MARLFAHSDLIELAGTQRPFSDIHLHHYMDLMALYLHTLIF